MIAWGEYWCTGAVCFFFSEGLDYDNIMMKALAPRAMKLHHIMPAIVALVASVEGCSILESVWLSPASQADVSFEQWLTNEKVLDAVMRASDEMEKKYGYQWSSNVTYLDVASGSLETGNFREVDRTGLRLRAQIRKNIGIVTIFVKGAGPYYSRLPVAESLADFKQALISKLDEASSEKPLK